MTNEEIVKNIVGVILFNSRPFPAEIGDKTLGELLVEVLDQKDAEFARLQAELNQRESELAEAVLKRDGLEAKVRRMRAALKEMLFAHQNADPEFPHDFEVKARKLAEDALADKAAEAPAKSEWYYKGKSGTTYDPKNDPEVTCWHCKETFLCDPMDACCRLCSAPFDKSRCKEFGFTPKALGQEEPLRRSTPEEREIINEILQKSSKRYALINPEELKALEKVASTAQELPQCGDCGGSGYIITADDEGRPETYKCTCFNLKESLADLERVRG